MLYSAQPVPIVWEMLLQEHFEIIYLRASTDAQQKNFYKCLTEKKWFNSQHVCQILKMTCGYFFNFWLICELYPFWFYTAYQKAFLTPHRGPNHSSSFKIWPLLNIFQSRVQSAYNFVATSQSTLQFIIFSRSGNNPPKMPPKRTASKPVGKLKYFNFI